MKLRRRAYGALGVAALMVATAGITASCGKKKKSSSDSEDTSKITVVGQLALSGESTSFALANPSLAELDVYCVTFSIPPVAGTGDVGADGKFELSLETDDGSVGCFILKAQDILGTLVFEDPSKKGLSGENQAADRQAFQGGRSDLGAITLDLSTGKAVVDITKITTGKLKDTSAAQADAVAFTGTYKVSSEGITPPTGYTKLCATESEDCRGPTEGMNLWLKSIKGASVPGGSPAHAMMIWPSQKAFETCGSKLGFSFEEGKKKGIDFTGAEGIGEGAFTWSAGYTDGWKKDGARARNFMMNMEMVDNFNGYAGQKQFFNQYRTWTCEPGQPCTESAPVMQKGFQFNANTKETGCKDASGKPVQLDNWNSMECSFAELDGGLNKNTCKKDVNGSIVTCINIGGTFKEDGAVLKNAMTRYPDDYDVYAMGPYCDYNGNSKFDGDEWPMWNNNQQSCDATRNPATTLSEGQLCSAIDTTNPAGQLAQLRCYAEALHNGNDRDNENACIRRVDGNWSAKTPAEFFGENALIRPENMFEFSVFKYDTATSGTIRGEERSFRGIQVGNNWTDCEVQESFSMSLKKMEGSNDLLAEMAQTERNVSAKPACIAAFGEGKTYKSLFKLLKQ